MEVWIRPHSKRHSNVLKAQKKSWKIKSVIISMYLNKKSQIYALKRIVKNQWSHESWVTQQNTQREIYKLCSIY